MNHPGGATCALGGVVIVHVSPSQVKAGKIVLWPMALPCVLTTDPSIETRRFAVEPEVRVNWMSSPYSQSVFSIVNVGRERPESK